MPDIQALMSDFDFWNFVWSLAGQLFAFATSSIVWTVIFGSIILYVVTRITLRIVHFFTERGRYGLIGNPTHFDETRIFTYDQKVKGHERAGNRCELEIIPFFRCKTQSSHADHYFAYSRGGATTMRNFVAACDKHNMRKGAKMPTASERARLQRRRRRYFLNPEDRFAGEWTSGGKRYRWHDRIKIAVTVTD